MKAAAAITLSFLLCLQGPLRTQLSLLMLCGFALTTPAQPQRHCPYLWELEEGGLVEGEGALLWRSLSSFLGACNGRINANNDGCATY